MSTQKQTITEAEYEIMRLLWDAEGSMTVSDVCERLVGREWTPSTVSTLLQRLSKKGIIGFTKRGKTNCYFPVMKRDEYSMSETKSFLSKLHGGSVKRMVASLYENEEISDDEIDELRKMFLESDK